MNVLIIDNEELFSNGLSALLKLIDTNCYVTKCININELSSDLSMYDMVIFNMNLYSSSPHNLECLLSNVNKNCKVVALNNCIDYTLLNYCKLNNVCGYLLKTYTELQFKSILTLIISGTSYFPSIVENNSNIKITKKQIEILRLIKSGLSNKQIAYELNISECTVKVHVSNIFKKFKCYNRVQLINKANELNIG